jgi:threonine/homoserine/homoserine lactone efflux protein
VNTLFSTALFLLCVYVLGFLAAIPIGASQIEVARRALGGFLASALVVVAGSISSDFMYGAIALYGLAPILQQPVVEAIFWLVNAAVILVFAIIMLRESKSGSNPKMGLDSLRGEDQKAAISSQPTRLANRRIAYFTGFSLAFTNPMMIAWWLLAARLLKDVGISMELTNTSRLFFLAAGCLGIGSYLSLLAITIHRRHKSFSQPHVRSITRWFGIAMIVFAIYFVIRSVMMLMSPGSLKNSILGSLFARMIVFHPASFLYLSATHFVSLHT